jgi:hypothetical protein
MEKYEGKGWTNGHIYNFQLNGQKDRESCFFKYGDIQPTNVYYVKFYGGNNYEVGETLEIEW